MNETIRNIICGIIIFFAGVLTANLYNRPEGKITELENSLIATRKELQQAREFTRQAGEGLARIQKLHNRIENLVTEERSIRTRIAQLVKTERNLHNYLEERNKKSIEYLAQNKSIFGQIRSRNNEAIKLIDRIEKEFFEK